MQNDLFNNFTSSGFIGEGVCVGGGGGEGGVKVKTDFSDFLSINTVI